MIGYVKKFEGNATMSFMINDSKLFKKYNQIWKRVEKLLKVVLLIVNLFYGDNDKYIKTKNIYIYMMVVWIQTFKAEKFQKKNFHASLYQ